MTNMTTYQLTITRCVTNEKYKPFDDQSGYYVRDDRTPEEKNQFIETALSVSLTEEQFEVIKKATFENWK